MIIEKRFTVDIKAVTVACYLLGVMLIGASCGGLAAFGIVLVTIGMVHDGHVKQEDKA